MNFKKKKKMLKILIMMCISLFGCSDVLEKNQGPREEFKSLSKPIVTVRPKIIKQPKKKTPPQFLQLLSINVDDSIPLKEIFIDLCKQAKVGCEISNNFEDNRVDFSAHQKAFIEILEDLCDVTHKRMTIIKDRIRIEEDKPHLVNYSIQFLNSLRKSENKVSTATQVLSGTQNEKNILDNGSSSTISTHSYVDFWKELNVSIKTILTHVPLSDDDEPGFKKSETLPKYSFHRQAGLLSIVATSAQHKAVSNYLEQLKKSATTQVLIEAKIIEVALDKQYESGIDWSFLSNISGVFPGNTTSSGAVALTYKNDDISGTLKLMERFGTTKTLSSPRLTVMNNQNAVLKIGENKVFFRLKYNQIRLDPSTRPNGSLTDMITANSEIQTVPIGITLSVQPSINMDTGDITLSIRPTITNSHKSVQDPAIDIMAQNSPNKGIKSEVPIIEVRELDSVLTIKSGRIAVIGGLMQEKSKDQTTGIPGTSGSFLDSLFGSASKQRVLTELVIFLKATILENSDPDEKDVDIYQNSIHDTRLWSMQ